MRRYALFLAILGSLLLPSHKASAGPEPGTADVAELLMGFSAKETCSCAFVVGQTDTYCQAFGQQPGYMVTLTIDHQAKTVTADVGIGETRTARVTSGGGCTLDGL
jgi:hypothetical protein